MSEIPSAATTAAWIDRIGKSEGIFAIACGLFSVATILLVLHVIDQSTWATFCQWIWASVVGGAAAAAYRK